MSKETVTKKELVELLAEKHDLTKKKANDIVADFSAFIVDNVAEGNKVRLSFGNFESRRREARTGRNPQTGESIKIPASNKPAFKAGKAFKEAVNK